jgi:hypothetical protein
MSESPEELIKQISVDDVLIQTLVTLINLGGRRLTVEEEKDPAQVKQAIEAARALLPLCPQEGIGPIKDALSQLQMLYVRETQGRAQTAESSAERAAPGEHQPPGQPAEPAEPAATDPERAKARSKIWIPPGA